MSMAAVLGLLIIAFLGAKTEIHIEGKDGWATNLPTYRIHNSVTQLIFGKQPVTGYHLWLVLFVASIVHLPLLLGVPWSISRELQLLALLCFFVVLEDFFWFVLNPHYGLKKFSSMHITWHKDWLWPFPQSYCKGIAFGLLCVIVSYKL
jgi:hypothetical protein